MHSDLRVLLVEQDDVDADRLVDLLRAAAPGACGVERAHDVDDAVRLLRGGAYDAVLVDPAAEGAADRIAAVRRAVQAVRAAPVLVLQHRERPVDLTVEDVGEVAVVDADDLDARVLGVQLVAAVERARLGAALEDAYARQRALAGVVGARDPLTGLWSAPVLLERVGDLVADAVRYHRPLSVCVVDLDGFGRLNAERGPAVADAVLVHLVGVVQQQLRAGDLLGRWGPDELLLALVGTPADNVRVLIERLQAAMRVFPFALGEGRRLHVSACFGIAGLEGLQTPEELVAAAEGALDRARLRGRGSVGMAASLVAPAAV